MLDNLSTHGPAALYEAFEPSVARQCLDLRIPYMEVLRREVGAREARSQ